MSSILEQLKAKNQEAFVSKIEILLDTFNPDVRDVVLQRAVHRAAAWLVVEITKQPNFPKVLDKWALDVAKAHTNCAQNNTPTNITSLVQLANKEPQENTRFNNAITAFCLSLPNFARLIQESYLTAYDVAYRLHLEVHALSMPTKAAVTA